MYLVSRFRYFEVSLSLTYTSRRTPNCLAGSRTCLHRVGLFLNLEECWPIKCQQRSLLNYCEAKSDPTHWQNACPVHMTIEEQPGSRSPKTGNNPAVLQLVTGYTDALWPIHTMDDSLATKRNTPLCRQQHTTLKCIMLSEEQPDWKALLLYVLAFQRPRGL